MVLEVVDDLNRDLVLGPGDIEREDFLPLWRHVHRCPDDAGMLNLLGVRALLVLVDQDLDHGLEAGRVEELIVELAIVDVEGQRAALHDWLGAETFTDDLLAAVALLQVLDPLFDLLDSLVEVLDVTGDELDVVLAVAEGAHLCVEELLLVDCLITVDVHVVEELVNRLFLVLMVDLLGTHFHEVAKFSPRELLIRVLVKFNEGFLKIFYIIREIYRKKIFFIFQIILTK